MRFGYSNHVSHLVDAGADVPQGSTQTSLCGDQVELGPAEELRLGQIPDCAECWERFSARTSGFSIAEAVMDATVEAGGERVGRHEVEGPNSL
jgi:hypothetical protein